ncbi:MAG: alpha/beta hydrolase [Bacillus sp. (in: firmicutes)]
MRNKNRMGAWIITRNIFLVIIAALLIWIAFHHIMNRFEQKKYPAIGQLVEVDGKYMHVYTKGDGENTIVLLSGLGTAAPVLDFEPLINELGKNNKVVVVEPFGYGWSDQTTKERSVENIVMEIRTALKKSNIEGPYILMPHSISGIYSMYYANKYPDEIKAVIGIDFTLPNALEYFNEPAPTLPEYMRYAAPIGISRLGSYLIPKNILPIADKGTYSDENLKLTKIIAARNGYNKNMVEEVNEIKNNIKKTNGMSFPSNMPVMIFTTKEDKVTADGKSNVTFYETQLRNDSSKIISLEGHHYLHWTRYKEMSNYVNAFIRNDYY